MAVTYSATIKAARMTAVRDTIDAGVGAGKLEILDAGDVLLAEIQLVEPCGEVVGGVLTFDFDPDISDTAANASGTAAKAQIKDGSGVAQVTGLTVGTSAADIILDSVAITAGQTVTITAGTITHA